MTLKPTLPEKQIFEKPREKRGYAEGPKERVHLDLTPEEKRLFQDLADRMLAGNMIGAFRRWLPIMERLVIAIEEGKRPAIIDDELNELELLKL